MPLKKLPPIDEDSILNPLRASITKWSNTLKQFVGKLATNCLNVFDHFVNLARVVSLDEDKTHDHDMISIWTIKK